MGGASAQCPGAWVQDSVYGLALKFLEVLRIEPLLLGVGVMTDKEVPLQGFVFRRKAVEGRDVVVVRQPIYVRLNRISSAQLSRIATGFEHRDRMPGLRQTCGNRASAGAGPNNNVFAVGLC